MKPEIDLFDSLSQFIYRYITYIGLILMGLMGRFSYDLIRNKKRNWSYIAGCTGIAILGGYMSSVYFMQNYPAKAPFMVPLITMISNNLVSAVMTIDYKALAQKDWKGAFEILFKK